VNDGFLHDALIYLAAAIVFVPLAKRLGMGSVLGYLLAGIIIGPFVLNFVGEEGKDIMHFAEFGVVMMLFLIGLELEPASFWRMRKLIVGTGVVQLCGTAILFFIGLLLAGFVWQAALASGLALSMSSTAIVMQTLREKALTRTESGKSSFAVLLFQDISVIPILALLPLLAMSAAHAPANPQVTLLEGLPGWAQTLELFDAGVRNIYRESLETSVRIGVDVLIKLGFRKYSATRAGQNFIKYDEAALPTLAAHRHDQETYIFNTRHQISMQEELLTNDRKVNPTLNDHAWDRSTDVTR